jgi:thioredoxin-related protein
MIKKIILIATFMSSILLAEMNWIPDLEDAYDVAEKENKIVMVMLSQEGCPGCEYMTDVVLKDDDVAKIFNRNFIAVYLDIHEDQVPLELKHFGTPTFYFLKADETILDVTRGTKNELDFLDKLENVKTLK